MTILIKWISVRRFNYLDAAAISVLVVYCSAGRYCTGLSAWLGLAVISIVIEAISKGNK